MARSGRPPVPARPLLLIDVAEGLGHLETDARLRARAAEVAGWEVRGLRLPAAAAGGRDVDAGWATLPSRLATEGADEIVVAGSRRAFRRVAAAAGRRPVRWWPTLLPGSEPGDPNGSGGGSRAAGETPAWCVEVTGTAAAFDLAVVRPPRERPLVPLWDGAFALVPGPLAGSWGRRVIETFAGVAADRPELDLVVLADLDDAFVRIARELGVYARVHFAGAATPEAENTWCATAAAALVPLAGPVSASLVPRVLAAGTPLVPFGDPAAVRPLDDWLAAHTGVRCGAPAQALAHALDAGPVARHALDRGRTEAARHVPDAVAERLPAPPEQARQIA